MSSSKCLTGLVLALCSTVIAFLLYALNWTSSADIGDLPPFLMVGGNLHPILLHLPIGIFIYLGFTESWNFLDRAFFKRRQISCGLPILAFGSVTAVLAALAGLLLYLQGDYSGELIDRHMYWGTGFAISTLVVLSCALVFNQNSQIYRLVLLLSIVGLAFASHQGGLITHGDPLEPLFKKKETAQAAKPVEALLSYEVVDKIFQSKCYNCHSTGKKQKGGLLMDSYEALLAGGKKGNALVPGNLGESKISTYLHLPLEDEHHMPPEGKPQLTEPEIEFIDAWILAGATPDGLLIEQGLSGQQYNWAINFMESAPIPTDEPESTTDEAEPPLANFNALITGIEHYALNSVARVGPQGQQLIFSAVNSRSELNDDVVDALLEAAPYLVDIDLSGTSLSTGAVQRLTQATPLLKRLNLSARPVDSQSIEPLVELNALESLILFNAQLDPNALPLICRLHQLRTLYLAGAGLSPEQIELVRQKLPGTEVVADDFLNKHQPTPLDETNTDSLDPE